MGIVIFDLSNTSYNEDASRNKFPLMAADNITPAKGKLDFSIKLTKNSNVITLQPVEVPLVPETIISEFETLIPKVSFLKS